MILGSFSSNAAKIPSYIVQIPIQSHSFSSALTKHPLSCTCRHYEPSGNVLITKKQEVIDGNLSSITQLIHSFISSHGPSFFVPNSSRPILHCRSFSSSASSSSTSNGLPPSSEHRKRDMHQLNDLMKQMKKAIELKQAQAANTKRVMQDDAEDAHDGRDLSDDLDTLQLDYLPPKEPKAEFQTFKISAAEVARLDRKRLKREKAAASLRNRIKNQMEGGQSNADLVEQLMNSSSIGNTRPIIVPKKPYKAMEEVVEQEEEEEEEEEDQESYAHQKQKHAAMPQKMKKEKPLSRAARYLADSDYHTKEMILHGDEVTVSSSHRQSCNTKLIGLYKSLLPLHSEVSSRNDVLHRLNQLVKSKWPNSSLLLFGSSASSLAIRGNSDVDICLYLPRTVEEHQIMAQHFPELLQSSQAPSYGRRRTMPAPIPFFVDSPRDVILQLASMFRKSNMAREVLALAAARVPIVKFKDAKSGLQCDICVNNVLAVFNTQLMKDYFSIDERAHQLALLIKYFCKRRSLANPQFGTLSSYSVSLLVIHFLQKHKPAPLLPHLQQMAMEAADRSSLFLPEISGAATRIEGVDVTYFKDISGLKSSADFKRRMQQASNFSTYDLMLKFFRYYAVEFDWTKQVVSIRKDSSVLRSEKLGWIASNPTSTKKNINHCMCVEDPLDTEFNTARIVNGKSLADMRFEFARAYETLLTSGNMEELFEQYNNNDNNNVPS